MVPEGWERRSLGEFVSEVVRRDGNGLPVLSVSKDLGIVLQTEKFGRIIASDDRSRYKRVRRGEFAYDPMLLWDGSIAQQTRVDEGVVSPAYYVFELNPSTVDTRFVEQFLTADRLKGHYRAISEGTNQRRRKARFEDFAGLEFPLPPLTEQRRIAAILSSVDDAIAATRKVIEQTTRVKQGLLQTLMTRGIGHTRFKRTEIGEIPEAWKVREIASVANVAYGVTVNQARRRSTDRLPLLTVAAHDLEKGWRLERMSEIGALEGDRAKYAAEPGDVLLVEGNGNPALLGRPLIWDGRIPEALHQNHLIRVRSLSTEPEWIALALSACEARRQICGQAKSSSGLYTINSTVVKRARIPIASARERREIISVVKCLNDAIAEDYAVLSALQKTKEGLMQDLLTGRVRAQPD